MNEPLMETQNPTKIETSPVTKRYRRAGKRKYGFRMDTPPFPVRAIWELATQDERTQAHQMGVLMLEHWLGRMTRKELGEKINLPPLRVWQMSQQALAGMVVGLMTQPKRPPKGTPMMQPEKPKEDVKALKARIASLEQDNRVLKELLDLVKDLPANRTESADSPKGKKKNPKETPANPLSSQGRNLAAGPKETAG